MSSRTAGEIWLGYRNSPDDSLDPGRRGMFFMHNQNVGSDQLDTAPYTTVRDRPPIGASADRTSPFYGGQRVAVRAGDSALGNQ